MNQLTEEIVDRFREGFARAQAARVPEPTAMTLATVDVDGRPSARTVLLKEMDAAGFVFYTNLESRKACHLAENSGVALVFWWRETGEQVLVEGGAEAVSEVEADAYFATRPRGSQVSAWASAQSSELPSREELLARVRGIEQRFSGREIPRPRNWGGYRVRPRRIEFWYEREFRLHERISYTLEHETWVRRLLYP